MLAALEDLAPFVAVQNSFPITVRNAISGEAQMLEVTPQMLIEDLRQKLLQDYSQFHVIKLLLDAAELDGGCCADVGLVAGCEVSIIVTASASLAMQVVQMELARVRFFQRGYTDERIMAAFTQLIQIGELQVQQSEILFDMLLKPCELWTDQYDWGAIIIKLAECFARTCSTCTIGVFVPKVLDRICQPPEPYLGLELLPLILTLHEILLAHGREALPRERLIAMFPLMFQLFQGIWKWIPGGWYASWLMPGDFKPYSRKVRQIVILEQAFFALHTLAMEFLDASIFPWGECAEVLKIELDSSFHMQPRAAGEARSHSDQVCPMLASASNDGSDGKITVPSGMKCPTGQASSADTVVSNGHEIETTPEMDETLRQSELEAPQKEQEQVAEAILWSKEVNGMPVSADDVMVFRLTAFSKCIQEALRMSPGLAACHQRVEEAGCKVHPSFSPATFFVPITAEQFSELDLSLQVHHVLALRRDRPHIIDALKAEPARNRPKLRADDHAFLVPLNALPAPSGKFTSEDHLGVQEFPKSTNEKHAETPSGDNVYISEETVLHAFIHIPVPKEISEEATDNVCNSAPARDASTSMQPLNHRRFKIRQSST